MRCDSVQKFKPKTCFSEKRIWEGFWGKIEQSFRPGQFCPRTHHISCLAPEIGLGPFSSKNSDKKQLFWDGWNFDLRHFCPQSRHLVRLAHKIDEVRFSTKIQIENVFYGKTNSRGLLRQNWAKFTSGTILPRNAQYSQLGPEKRYEAGFIKKFQPKTCFLG